MITKLIKAKAANLATIMSLSTFSREAQATSQTRTLQAIVPRLSSKARMIKTNKQIKTHSVRTEILDT